MKTSTTNTKIKSALIVFWLFSAAFAVAQSPNRPIAELHKEVTDYVKVKSRELLSQGKKVDADRRESLTREQKALAKKYAAESATRTDLKGIDVYYLGIDLGDYLLNARPHQTVSLLYVKRHTPANYGRVTFKGL